MVVIPPLNRGISMTVPIQSLSIRDDKRPRKKRLSPLIDKTCAKKGLAKRDYRFSASDLQVQLLLEKTPKMPIYILALEDLKVKLKLACMVNTFSDCICVALVITVASKVNSIV